MSENHLDRGEHDVLGTVRNICLGYPEATETEKWDNPAFLVREKIFLLVSRHEDGRIAMWVKAPPGVQEALIAAEPDRYFKPPYLGPKGWVAAWVSPETNPAWTTLEDLIDESYRLIAPKRLVNLLGSA
jgi:hypothetical protein